ncbi:MAG: nuclear transport factor 2 family protein [Deltaproteobacteria bacterium]|nr:nuclear transport factor 2 family protein [Deltaproteobacteria bacterium]
MCNQDTCREGRPKANPRALAALARAGALVVVCALVLSGCHVGSRGHDEGRQFAAAWIAAMNSHSVEQVLGLFEPKGTYEDLSKTPPVSGTALRELLFQQWSTWGDLTYTLTSVVAEGDLIALDWQVRGTDRAGKTFSTSGATFIERRHGFVVRARSYYAAPLPLGPGAGAAS